MLLKILVTTLQLNSGISAWLPSASSYNFAEDNFRM